MNLHVLTLLIIRIYIYTVHFCHSVTKVANISRAIILVFRAEFYVESSVDFNASYMAKLTTLGPVMYLARRGGALLVVCEPVLAQFADYHNPRQ